MHDKNNHLSLAALLSKQIPKPNSRDPRKANIEKCEKA